MNLNDRFYKADYKDEEFQQLLRDATEYCIENGHSLEEGEDERGYYVVISPIIVPVKTLTELKADKKADIATARYSYEIAGVAFRGVHVTTDREDQGLITAVALSAVIDPAFSTVWKGADGYLELDSAGVLSLAHAVATHVETAFAEEKRLADLIDAAQSEDELAPIVWTLS